MVMCAGSPLAHGMYACTWISFGVSRPRSPGPETQQFRSAVTQCSQSKTSTYDFHTCRCPHLPVPVFCIGILGVGLGRAVSPLMVGDAKKRRQLRRAGRGDVERSQRGWQLSSSLRTDGGSQRVAYATASVALPIYAQAACTDRWWACWKTHRTCAVRGTHMALASSTISPTVSPCRITNRSKQGTDFYTDGGTHEPTVLTHRALTPARWAWGCACGCSGF
jgi:hypothetical protein